MTISYVLDLIHFIFLSIWLYRIQKNFIAGFRIGFLWIKIVIALYKIWRECQKINVRHDQAIRLTHVSRFLYCVLIQQLLPSYQKHYIFPVRMYAYNFN